MRSITLIAAGLLGLSSIGCASTTVAPERVAAPTARIAAAEEAGAREHPKAALHLKLANDAFDRARRLIADGDGDRARLVLDRATADAELALELARLDKTRGAADDAMKSIDAMRKTDQVLEAD